MSRANICGSRIKQLREQRGFHQVDLAAALCVEHEIDMNQSDISEIERGVRSLRDYELDAISRVLCISPLWLLRGEADK